MLPRLIGARFWELMLTGRVIDSDEANRIGLVSNVTADEDLASTCLAVAREIREIALRRWMTKEVMWSNLKFRPAGWN